VAAGVVEDLALDHGLAGVGGVVLQEAGAAGVDFDLELDAELAAVAEDVVVDGGQACWAYVLVVAGIEGAGLFGAVGEGDGVAAADSPVAAARAGAGFENGAVESEGEHLVGGDETGDAAAEDDDFDTFSGVGGDGEVNRDLRHGGHEAHGLHSQERCAVAASLPYSEQEVTPGYRHGISPRSAGWFG
jgi:hypothetical protein